MAKAKLKPRKPTPPHVEERLSLVVAAAFAGSARISLGHIEHGGYRVIPDFDKLCEARACLSGALEIVDTAIERAKERL